MSITGKFRALVAPIAVLALGLAACQSQGTGISIATDEEGVAPASWLAKPDGDGPFPAVVLMHGCSGIEKNTSHQDCMARPGPSRRAVGQERIRHAHCRQLRPAAHHGWLPEIILFRADTRRVRRIRSSGIAAVRRR